YHAQNFPDAPLDWSALKWNARETRSNVKELTSAALATNGGSTWLTEASLHVSSHPDGPNPALSSAYESTCVGRPPREVPCDPSVLPAADGGADAGCTKQ